MASGSSSVQKSASVGMSTGSPSLAALMGGAQQSNSSPQSPYHCFLCAQPKMLPYIFETVFAGRANICEDCVAKGDLEYRIKIKTRSTIEGQLREHKQVVRELEEQLKMLPQSYVDQDLLVKD